MPVRAWVRAPVGSCAKTWARSVESEFPGVQEGADDEPVEIEQEGLKHHPDPDPCSVSEEAPGSVPVEVGEAEPEGRAAAPEQGAVNGDVADSVGGVAEDDRPDSASQEGKRDPGDRCRDQGEGMDARQGAEFEVAPELGFRGQGRGPEEIEGSEDHHRRGHAAAVLAVDEYNRQGNGREGPERPQAGI